MHPISSRRGWLLGGRILWAYPGIGLHSSPQEGARGGSSRTTLFGQGKGRQLAQRERRQTAEVVGARCAWDRGAKRAYARSENDSLPCRTPSYRDPDPCSLQTAAMTAALSGRDDHNKNRTPKIIPWALGLGFSQKS